MFARVADSYRRTAKPKDLFWNKYVARPVAALLILPLEHTRVTPNQVTFASLFVFLAAAALLILCPGHTGLLLAVATLQFSYVLDCADGQLARLRGTSTPIGAHLDFLMDELKAFVLVSACGARLFRVDSDWIFLIEGLVGLCAVAAGITLTSFVRRPEYAAATGARVAQGAGDYGQGFAAPAPVATSTFRSPLRAALGLVEGLGKFLVHYPSYIVYIAAVDRLDIFLHLYAAINAAYAGRMFLVVFLKLGRFAPAKGKSKS